VSHGTPARAGGCTFAQDAQVDIDTQVRFAFGEIGTTCEGGGRAVDGANVTAWTKTPAGDQCRVDFVWDGTLIAGLRDQVTPRPTWTSTTSASRAST
jgi:hypothetical protein